MPHQAYYTKDGQRVPSVTTISGPYGDCGGLMYWANQQGLNGNTLKDARAATATPGSMIHERVDAYIKGVEWTPESWREKFDTVAAYEDACILSARGFENFQRWHEVTQFNLISGEIALVSEEHKFGGCLDAIMTRDGVALCDWKSGKNGSALYASNLYQLAGYSILWDENFPARRINAGYHIIRFSRDKADFGHNYFSELDTEREVFLKLREVYELNKQVSKRVK